VCVGGENSRASLAASLSARAPGRGSLRAPDAAASAKTAPSCAPDNGSNGRSGAAGERSRPPAGNEGTVAGAVGGRVGRVGGASKEGRVETLGGGAGVWRLHSVREAPRAALRQGKHAQRGPKST